MSDELKRRREPPASLAEKYLYSEEFDWDQMDLPQLTQDGVRFLKCECMGTWTEHVMTEDENGYICTLCFHFLPRIVYLDSSEIP